MIYNLFNGLWMGFTFPLSMTFIFWAFRPVITLDHSVAVLIIVALVVGFVDFFLGNKLYYMKIKPMLDKKKKKRHFP